jgi:hypothetical protein
MNQAHFENFYIDTDFDECPWDVHELVGCRKQIHHQHKEKGCNTLVFILET